mmetsp:Transcript_149613/g.480225  ORF Transcript_149613/g.480225 Transcript_149613/m.480225 type:complete len:467 (-) Transcript_149613:209-1609(-)
MSKPAPSMPRNTSSAADHIPQFVQIFMVSVQVAVLGWMLRATMLAKSSNTFDHWPLLPQAPMAALYTGTPIGTPRFFIIPKSSNAWVQAAAALSEAANVTALISMPRFTMTPNKCKDLTHAPLVPHALMAAVQPAVLHGMPCASMKSSKINAFHHSLPFSQALMAVLQVMLFISTACFPTLHKISSAFTHSPPRPQAPITELKVPMSGWTPLATMWAMTSKARIHSPPLAQALMAAVPVYKCMSMRTVHMNARHANACCHWNALSQALMAALPENVVGGMDCEAMVCKKSKAFVHSPAEQMAVIKVLHTKSSGSTPCSANAVNTAVACIHCPLCPQALMAQEQVLAFITTPSEIISLTKPTARGQDRRASLAHASMAQLKIFVSTKWPSSRSQSTTALARTGNLESWNTSVTAAMRDPLDSKLLRRAAATSAFLLRSVPTYMSSSRTSTDSSRLNCLTTLLPWRAV